MTKNIPLENRLASFPVGYYTLHPDASINFQMNRFYDWVGDPSMLTEMREAGAFAQDYPTFTQIFLELGEKTIAEGNIYKGAAYLRMAEFFLFADDPRKLPTLRRIIKLLLLHHQVTEEQHFRIPYESAWLSAYRFTPPQPKGTLVAFGGFDSYCEEWLPAAFTFRDAGYDTIVFDGPGQGLTLEEAGLTMIPEWEKPVKAVLDFFQLDDVTLVGESLGGELVIRAAAFEPRVQRVIAYDILTDVLETNLRNFPASVGEQVRGWLESGNENALNAFFEQARSQSLLLDWMLKQANHVTGTQTVFEALRHFQRFETASISPKVTQDVLLLAGSEDHYVPIHQLPDQIATLTHARSLTVHVFTPYEQAQNHVQVGNYGLALRTMIEWIESLQVRGVVLANRDKKERTMIIDKRDVTFKSGDTFAAGWFFLPEHATSETRVPAVAMAHGLGAVKEMYLEPFARRFAEAGIAVLVFDYRSFGASGGEPRQRLFPRDQIEDYRSALTWLSLQPEIDADRLGVWGSSFSGGHVLHVAAYDPRVKAVVSQVGAMDVHQITLAAVGAEQFAALEQLTVQERVRHVTEGGEVYIPDIGLPGQGFALQTDQESYDFARGAQATIAPSWRNEVTMSSLDAILEHAPAKSIELIAPRPLLMILAKDDPISPPDSIRAAFARAGEPKRLLEVEGSHYSVYPWSRGRSADQASQAATEWFAEHLVEATATGPSERRARVA